MLKPRTGALVMFDTYYLYKNKGESFEEVKPERWGWGVVYNDGTELHQFEIDKNTFHQFGEIEQDKVKMLVMYRLDDMNKRIDVPLPEGKAQIFHFYRNVVFSAATQDERRARVYVFGWKARDTGDSTYCYILPDDRFIVSPTDIKVSEFGI